VRAYPTAALAAGNLGGRLVETRVGKRSTAASVTAALEKLSVHVDDVLRTRLLVQAVHVLRADEQAVLQRVFKFGEGEVRRIRLGFRSHAPTHGIELPHQPRIASPSLGRGDLLDPIVPPESAHAPESWDAAFRAHSCPGKNEDSVSRGNCEHGRKDTTTGGKVHGESHSRGFVS